MKFTPFLICLTYTALASASLFAMKTEEEEKIKEIDQKIAALADNWRSNRIRKKEYIDQIWPLQVEKETLRRIHFIKTTVPVDSTSTALERYWRNRPGPKE